MLSSLCDAASLLDSNTHHNSLFYEGFLRHLRPAVKASMEKQLSDMLTSLHLEEYPAVTRGTNDACLFAGAIDRIREYAVCESAKTKARIPVVGGDVDAKITTADGRESTFRITTILGFATMLHSQAYITG
jgi:hypothetical protein